MSDAVAVEELVGHRYFRPHRTPLQVFNRATDPFLPNVVPHTLTVLEDLDGRGLTNHVLVITRHNVTDEHCLRLNALRNIKLTVLFTYSGIDDARIEPFPSKVSAVSMVRATAAAESYRTVFYWRPLVPGLNDSPEKLRAGVRLSTHAHAAVFTGLFYRAEIAHSYKASGLPEPYETDARRKIVPETLEERVLAAFAADESASTVFRKTSCAVSFTHNVPDYNGHYGIRELCDICPLAQLGLCQDAHQQPTTQIVLSTAARLPEAKDIEILEIDDRAVVIAGLEHEQPPLLPATRPGLPGPRRAAPASSGSARAGRHRVEHRRGRRTNMTSNPPNAENQEWSRAKVAVVDVEGNGAHPPDLVELAITLILDGKPQPATSWLVRPPTAISWRAKNVHGITNEEVADAPPVADIQDYVLALLCGVDIVVGHQVRVDLDVMTRSFPAWSPRAALDTLRLARAQYPDLPSHKLGDLTQALNLDPLDGRAHRAGHDTTVTARLLVHLAGALPQPATVADLLERGSWPARPAHHDHQEELDLTTS